MASVIQAPRKAPVVDPNGDSDHYEHFKVRRLTPHTGASITGLSLADLSVEAITELKQAFARYSLLVFPNQPLATETHKAFARNFGTLHIHPSFSHLGRQGDPELFIIDTKPDSKFSNGEAWHTDVSCEQCPPMASLLYVADPPPYQGGDTMFANMTEAYEALSPKMRDWLLTLEAVHDGRKDLNNYGYELKPGETYPRAQHPVVTRHPDTGKPILFVNISFTSHLVGFERSESDAVLNMLYKHAADNPRWQVRVSWEPHTMVMWDNRCLHHHAVWDYFPNSRLGRRVTVQCPVPPEAYADATAFTDN